MLPIKRPLFRRCEFLPIIILVTFCVLSCTKEIELESEDSLNWIIKTGETISNKLVVNGIEMGCQGMAINDKVMYLLYDTGICQSIDISDINNPIPLNVFKLGSYRGDNHCNSAQFYYENNVSYLYVAGCNKKCYVEKIEADTSSLVQTITVSLDKYSMDYNVICGDNNSIVAFGGEIPQGSIYLFKFRRPSVCEGDVTLTDGDLIGFWEIESNYVYSERWWQGGKYYNNMLYFVFGTVSKGKELIIYNTKTSRISNRLLFDNIMNEEPEDCELYGDRIVVSLNNGKGYYLVDSPVF